MPALRLLCDRPHVNTIDFSAARLVVGTARGLNVNGQLLTLGDEIPQGALSVEALRQEYDAPLRRIELLDYALADPDLHDAVIRRRPAGDAPTKTQSTAPPEKAKEVRPDLDSLTRHELARLCNDNRLSNSGNKTDLLRRLKAHLGR